MATRRAHLPVPTIARYRAFKTTAFPTSTTGIGLGGYFLQGWFLGGIWVVAFPGAGLDGLQAVCAEISIPVFALGGIKLENVSRTMDRGSWGIALISGIWNAKNPSLATSQFLQKIGCLFG